MTSAEIAANTASCASTIFFFIRCPRRIAKRQGSDRAGRALACTCQQLGDRVVRLSAGMDHAVRLGVCGWRVEQELDRRRDVQVVTGRRALDRLAELDQG